MITAARSPALLSPSPPFDFPHHYPKHSRALSSSPPVSYPGSGVERNSSESTIVSIYSMYTERRASWSANPSPSTTPPSSTHLSPGLDYQPEFVNSNGLQSLGKEAARKSGIDVVDPALAHSGRRQSSISPRLLPDASPSTTPLLSTHLSLGLVNRSEFAPLNGQRRSMRESTRKSAIDVVDSSQAHGGHRQSSISSRGSPELSEYLTPSSVRSSSPGQRKSDVPTPPASSTPSGSRQTSPVQPPTVPSSSSTHTDEDPESFHVRNTYAQLDQSGVKGDGFEEGVELTRARLGYNSPSNSPNSTLPGNGKEKRREITPKEVQLLSSLDRYGFFVVPSHERLVLLPTSSKPLSRSKSAPSARSPPVPLLPSLPPVKIGPKETSRIAKWERMLETERRDEGGNAELWTVKSKKSRKLRERTYKGIPDRWRRAAWPLLVRRFSATATKESFQHLQEGYMANLDLPSSYDIQIDLDVPRTINGHVLFRTRYGLGQRSLFHVLHSFSLRCSDCGYCQGMGSLASTLLCYFEPELAYALLAQMHDLYGMHAIFSPGFPGLLEAIYIQERMMEKMVPEVYAALKQQMISTTSYATKWYITLFANTVPFQTQLRMWDAFLLEGRDTLVVGAVAIIWFLKDHLTGPEANFETVLSLLSSFFVPQDEEAFMKWIEKTMEDKKLREDMQRWREDWKGLVQSGQDQKALL